MEILQLKYFCDAAEKQNISYAAKLNMVPASGVSTSIKRLEQELGTPLFYRYANKIKLTDRGKIFYENVSRIMNELDGAVKEIQQTDEPAGKIVICIMSCEKTVETAVAEFKKAYPGVDFELHQRVKNALNADFYISDEEFYIRGCLKTNLIEEELVLAVSRDSPYALTESILISDLKKEKFVCTNSYTNIYHRVNSVCFDNGFVPDIAVTVTAPEKAIKYIEDGICIGIFPKTEIVESPGVVLKKLDCPKRKVCAFYEESRMRVKINQLFLDKLTEVSKAFIASEEN